MKTDFTSFTTTGKESERQTDENVSSTHSTQQYTRNMEKSWLPVTGKFI
jgi:hypothetical protein